jgi:hypothetical protein
MAGLRGQPLGAVEDAAAANGGISFSVLLPDHRPHSQEDRDYIRVELRTGHNFGDGAGDGIA